MTDRMKAYAVLETDENTGGIVFATRPDQARRRATARFFGGDETETTCRREPWADVHVDGQVPAGKMVEQGWRFECSNCNRTIDGDMADEYATPDEEEGIDDRYVGWKPTDVIGGQDGVVYCNVRCRDDHRTETAKRKRMSERAVRRFARILLERLPDAEIVDKPDSYGGRPGAEFRSDTGVPLLQSVRVPFTYPGARYGYAAIEYSPRGFRPDRRVSYMCPSGDVEAFDAYLATHPRKDSSHD